MAFIRAFFAAAFALATIVAAEESDVVTLTDKTFAEFIGKEKLVFVKFFAPWCGHCQSMAEDFKKAATELKGQAVLADVDATKEEELAKQYNIDGFPTLKLFADGEEVVDYNGGRDKESMKRFIERATVPPFVKIESADEYKKFADEHKDKNILLGADLDKPMFSKFRKAAFGLRDVMPDTIEFGLAASIDHIDVKDMGKNDIYLLRVESDGSYTPMKFDPEGDGSLDKFVKGAALPPFQEFTQENAELYTELTTPLIVGFYKDCEGAQCKALEKIAKKKTDNGKVVFSWVNSETLSSFQEYVGLQKAEVPICAYAFETDARYMLPEDFKFSEAALEAWVDDMIAGKVIPARKSEPIPTKNEGPVYTVVGDSWADVVEDTEKDVFVAQVAEWCGHCAALKPIIKKVAQVLKDAGVAHVKFAMMDATENDAPEGYKAQGFPTVHFFPAGEKQEGISFEGDRTSKGIIEWIQNRTTKKFEFDTSTLGEDPAPEEDEDDDDDEEDEEEDGEEEGEGEEEAGGEEEKEEL